MNTISIPDAVQELMRELMPQTRQPRYRYFENHITKAMYCWTVEPIGGKYACWTYQPKGEGSRTGNPQKWAAIDRVDFAKRKTAKARAYSRYQKSMEAK